MLHSVFQSQSALLGEQQSVMQRCAEERRRLAGEWTEFHTQQKLNNGRMERDTNRSLQLNAQQEGTIFSLAKVSEKRIPLIKQ